MLELDLSRDEGKNQNNRRNDIRNTFMEPISRDPGIPLDAQRVLSDNKPIQHERDTSERKINFKRKAK